MNTILHNVYRRQIQMIKFFRFPHCKIIRSKILEVNIREIGRKRGWDSFSSFIIILKYGIVKNFQALS